jgi:hypothetical protein
MGLVRFLKARLVEADELTLIEQQREKGRSAERRPAH